MELQRDATWFCYLDEPQQELVSVSFSLLDKQQALTGLVDYSFIVFSMSKAYEGFLKKVFFDLGLINKETYEGRKFRIGRALNPDIRVGQRDEDWLYDNVAAKFGKSLARQLWDTWLLCRNRVFHYFHDNNHFLTFTEATQRIAMMVATMETVAKQLAL